MSIIQASALAGLSIATACGDGARTAPSAASVARLRWIEGTWRGTGDVDAPFYERYRFEDDSTLLENGLDSTLAVAQDTSRFELRDGRFGDVRWRATVLAGDSVVFVREGQPGQSFRWRRNGPAAWTAVIVSPGGQRVYHMERWPR